MFTNLAIQRGHHLAWLSRHPVAMTTAGPVRWFSWPLRRWLSRPCARMAQCCAGGIHTTPGAVELSWSWWCSGPSTRNGESLRKIFVYIIILVGGLEHFLFSPIAGMMIQSDSYFSEGLKPPTSSCKIPQQFNDFPVVNIPVVREFPASNVWLPEGSSLTPSRIPIFSHGLSLGITVNYH